MIAHRVFLKTFSRRDLISILKNNNANLFSFFLYLLRRYSTITKEDLTKLEIRKKNLKYNPNILDKVQ